MLTTISPVKNGKDNSTKVNPNKRPLPNDPPQSTSTKEKKSKFEGDDDNDEDEIIESDPEESDLHSNDNNRKSRAEKIYNIKKPKNIRVKFDQNDIPHLFDWTPKPRGYVLYVRGKDFRPKIVNEILRNTTLNIGILMGYFETSSQAIITLEDEAKRQAAMQAIKESEKDLTVEAAQYRPTALKFEVDFPVTEADIPNILEEIRAFNLKAFGPTFTFEKLRWYKLKGTVFTVICVSVSPKIRDFMADKGKGVFYLRGKQLVVQDYFMVRRCFGCGFIGHLVNRCKDRQSRCLKCSGPHKKTNCTSNVLRCPTCKGDHEAFTISCETFREEIQRDMNNVDYQYTKILWSPQF